MIDYVKHFKSIAEENALTDGTNCVTKSQLTTYANTLTLLVVIALTVLKLFNFKVW